MTKVNTGTEENKMGTDPMGRLVLMTGIPMMLSLLINSLYNFVDSVFVSHISEEALTALSLAGPVQILMSSLGLGNAVGLNAVISRALGEKDPDKVKKAANGAIFIAFCSWIIIGSVCLLFSDLYFRWQSGGNEIIERYGKQYLTICMLFSLGQMGQWVFDRFVIASGRPSLFIFTLSAASLTNLILDPIFIFGLLGLPRMETTGAALATVIGQFVGAGAGIYINRRWNKEIPFAFTLKQDRESIGQIIKVGFPSTLVQILTSAISVAMNSILLDFSGTAVAVYGICARIQGLCTVGVSGINNGMIPIVAYNYGAKNKERIYSSVKYAILYGALLLLPFVMILEGAPQFILRIFDASDHMMNIAVPAIRILGISYLMAIPGQVIVSYLQGLSLGRDSMYISMARQAIMPLVFVVILCRFGNLNLIWTGFLFAELVCIPPAIWFFRRADRKCLIEDPAYVR